MNQSFEQQKIEQEPQKPKLIIDFVRHGDTEYGSQVIKRLKKAGQPPDTFKQLPKINEEIVDPLIGIEGRLTEAGIEQIRISIQRLIESIDKKNEIIFVITGPRTRHKQSTDVVVEELIKAGVQIYKIREHKNLTDFKDGWIGLVDFIKNIQNKENVDLEEFWWEMYKNEETKKLLNDAGYEGLHDIERRMAAFVKILKKFVSIYKPKKTLRVIAVTSDVNIEQVLQRDIPPLEKDQIWIKNGEIAELTVSDKGQSFTRKSTP